MSLSLIMTSCDKKKKADVPVNEYTIKFVDYDNFLLSTLKVKEGTVPVYDGEEPYRDPTREYSYTFAGWTPELVAATADTTYKATYSEEVRKYTIKFVNEDGTELQSESLPYGSTPVYKGTTPTKDATAQYTYTFENWDKPIEAVKKNATYTATYSSVVNSYQVTFDTHGGSNINSQTVPYGGHVTQPADPTKDPTGDAYYVFDGWDFDFENTVVTGPIIINASWYEADSSMPHGNDCVYIHYPQYLPKSGDYGYKEFWYCPVHHEYVMTEPASTHIVEASSSYSETILSTDERYISLIYDEDHLPLTEYAYGADMFCVEEDDYKTFRVDYEINGYNCELYSNDNEKLLWRIDLPRIDFTRYPSVTIDVTAPDWYNQNMMGPELDELDYHTNYGGNKTEGKIKLDLIGTFVHMTFNSLEYATQIVFKNIFTDSDIINGLKSAYFYTDDLYDRYINFSNIILLTESQKVDVYSYAGDTSKLGVENGTAKKPNNADYSIINNAYCTEFTGMCLDGNANPGAGVMTLPAFNMNPYLQNGKISFKFGVRNNNEPMYFGSGDSKVALGNNSPTSQAENNNGFVNWEMVISADSAYVHNTYSNQNYNISISSGVRAGIESIVLSGGNASIYRCYLVCDFYFVS